jgi:hypothetical protein
MNEGLPELGTEQPLVLDPDDSTSFEQPERFTGDQRFRWFAWAVGVAVFAAFVMLARVHTRLGVVAPPRDKNGREYVWRVWWRARDDVVNVGSDGTVAFVYVALAMAFVALGVLAFWLALVPDERAPEAPAESWRARPSDIAGSR